MNFIERKVVVSMVKSVLNRIFAHWKTTTAGTAITASLVGIFVAAYKPGMSWKEWLIAAVPMVVGAALKDPGKQ